MHVIELILLIAAALAFFAATLRVTEPFRIQLIAAGLFAWVVAVIIPLAQTIH